MAPGERVLVTSRRGSVVAPVRIDDTLRPGLAFMTLHFPDEVETNVLTIDATDPKSGTAEFKASAIRVEKLPAGASQRGCAGRGCAGPLACSRVDLRLTASEPSAAERATVDLVLGPPASAWEGAARGADGHSARGGHAARSQRHLLLPVLHELQGRVGWISAPALGYVCRRLDDPARRGLRRRQLLRAVRAGAAAAEGRPCLHRHRVHVPRRRRARRRARTHRRARRAGVARRYVAIWLESPCLGLCEQAPAALLTIAGEDASDHAFGSRERDRASPRRWRARTPRRLRAGAGRAGRRRAAAAAAHRPRRPREHRQLSQRRRLRRAAARARARTGRSDPRGDRGEADGPRRRRVPDRTEVGCGGRNPVQPHYLVCNADESEPGTFKDRIVIENDPFALIEALTDRRLRDRLRARLHLRARRVPAGLAAADQRDRARPMRTACSARTCWAPGSRSTSSCARAPGPTSAARRRRCSTRSRASAASRATSRRSRWTSGCSASRPSSTTSRA